jgi:hypothetical protein
MYVIDLKDRTIAEFKKDELMNFATTLGYKKTNKSRYWVVETKAKAIKVVKDLIKKGF